VPDFGISSRSFSWFDGYVISAISNERISNNIILSKTAKSIWQVLAFSRCFLGFYWAPMSQIIVALNFRW